MERTVKDIPEMYCEMMVLMKNCGKEENSRNGRVLSLPEPLLVAVTTPTMRVNTDLTRRCNPFFHVMEFVWMMAGSQDPDWISQFNKRFTEYADQDTNLIHGAYGHRWIYHYHSNQIAKVTEMLRANPETRRAVIAMWDAEVDLGTEHNDLPCNTHIYLRVYQGKLDMTVCNRSNDVIWGMTGANAVHMTMLQEMIANSLGVPVGVYRVFSNNSHVYLDLKDLDSMLLTQYTSRLLRPRESKVHIPILADGESIEEFMIDCMHFLLGSPAKCHWMKTVAKPVYDLWFNREATNHIKDTYWKDACNLWLRRG